MKKILSFLIAVTFACSLTGCYTHTHNVGTGAQSGVTESKGQWYILFGLVPLNSVDSKSLAGGAANYKITTQQTFVDGVISILTGFVTISKQTVTVTK